jgi:hypothetical protein
MSRLKPDTAWRRIVINARLPAKARIMALEQIVRPPNVRPINLRVPAARSD